MQGSVGVVARPNVELRRILDRLSCRRIPVSEFVFSEREMKGLFFVRRQGDSFKALQFSNRPRGSARLLVNIELRHLDARLPACVLDIYGDVKALSRS